MAVRETPRLAARRSLIAPEKTFFGDSRISRNISDGEETGVSAEYPLHSGSPNVSYAGDSGGPIPGWEHLRSGRGRSGSFLPARLIYRQRSYSTITLITISTHCTGKCPTAVSDARTRPSAPSASVVINVVNLRQRRHRLVDHRPQQVGGDVRLKRCRANGADHFCRTRRNRVLLNIRDHHWSNSMYLRLRRDIGLLLRSGLLVPTLLPWRTGPPLSWTAGTIWSRNRGGRRCA
jgi:hypothetical protein